VESKKESPETPRDREPEWSGPIWKHPYFLYVILTIALFAFLLIMAWVALNQDWIPQR